ncbi:ladinin-1-like [Pongo abelii]|uniref:ladinin-1-like n=1 Tax=Pongo abelii TaxID=9601 RepID=UPI00300512E5
MGPHLGEAEGRGAKGQLGPWQDMQHLLVPKKELETPPHQRQSQEQQGSWALEEESLVSRKPGGRKKETEKSPVSEKSSMLGKTALDERLVSEKTSIAKKVLALEKTSLSEKTVVSEKRQLREEAGSSKDRCLREDTGPRKGISVREGSGERAKVHLREVSSRKDKCLRKHTRLRKETGVGESIDLREVTSPKEEPDQTPSWLQRRLQPQSSPGPGAGGLSEEAKPPLRGRQKGPSLGRNCHPLQSRACWAL